MNQALLAAMAEMNKTRVTKKLRFLRIRRIRGNSKYMILHVKKRQYWLICGVFSLLYDFYT
jgi:hypothetical protein